MDIDQDKLDQEMTPQKPLLKVVKPKDVKMESSDIKSSKEKQVKVKQEAKETPIMTKIIKREEIKERKTSKTPKITTKKSPENIIKMEVPESKVVRRRSARRKSRK